MMKKSMSIFIAATIMFCACNNASEQTTDTSSGETASVSHESHAHATTDDSKVETVQVVYKDLNDQTSLFVKNLVSDYLRIKSALVDGNEKLASKAAVTLNDHLKSFDRSYFTTAQKKQFDAIADNLHASSAEVATQYLDDQRKSFRTLSDNMYILVKNFDAGQTLYKEYCPMYEGGAAWLSAEKEIRNPYYGDKMMKCGTVKAVIQ